jgi:transcriptional regulator with XRE-family HTH domain
MRDTGGAALRTRSSPVRRRNPATAVARDGRHSFDPVLSTVRRRGDKRRLSAFRYIEIVISRTTVARETERRVTRQKIRIGEEILNLRLDAGVSLRELGAATGLHPSHIARIEAGKTNASVEALTAIGVALGADLGIKFFAGSGPRLLDRFQAPMIEAFLRQLDPRWSVRLEVPVTTPARGVVDAALSDRSAPIAVAAEFQSELRGLERLLRWSNEKADGLAARLAKETDQGGTLAVSRLLVVRSTVATREIARQFEATLEAAYPALTADVVKALTTPDAPWPGAGIVWMRLEKGVADLLAGPPRGVRLGR